MVMEGNTELIIDSSFGSLNYLAEEAKYTWRYHNNVYKKYMAVLLFIALVFFQDSYIGSLAFLILAFITLTLRCW